MKTSSNTNLAWPTWLINAFAVHGQTMRLNLRRSTLLYYQKFLDIKKAEMESIEKTTMCQGEDTLQAICIWFVIYPDFSFPWHWTILFAEVVANQISLVKYVR